MTNEPDELDIDNKFESKAKAAAREALRKVRDTHGTAQMLVLMGDIADTFNFADVTDDEAGKIVEAASKKLGERGAMTAKAEGDGGTVAKKPKTISALSDEYWDRRKTEAKTPKSGKESVNVRR